MKGWGCNRHQLRHGKVGVAWESAEVEVGPGVRGTETPRLFNEDAIIGATIFDKADAPTFCCL